ncbi:POZ domain-containing protein [Dacryopinax primogenitus]|uniref:Elongin-C n=1 Tax=Dacryopinax primogenitus (strain DJM 731) TaxID=1858805 RepID=M5FVG3_DACPD|nr:POZ domain-containing protein [Dacryopinax primogenitus]EJT99599.1 POZ domain-containing protein [Dacryopinax primogenitus]
MEDNQEEGPSGWVKLISDDGFTFILPEKAAQTSGFFKSTLNSTVGFQESETKVIRCGERAAVLETVVEYLVFKSEFGDSASKTAIPDFMKRIPAALALEILMAADFLDC